MFGKKKMWKNIVIGLVGLVIVFSVVSLCVVKYFMDDRFKRTVLSEYSFEVRYEDVKEQYDRELFNFMSGDNELQGYLYGLDNSKGLVVVAHGIGGGAENYMAQILYFVDNGYKVLAYDNTGCYESGGDDCIGLPQSAVDLDAALTYIDSEERFKDFPVFLFGHSWGGYAVTAVLNETHNVTAVASVSGFNDPMTMMVEWAERMMGVLAYLEAPYIYIYEKSIVGDNLATRAVDGINKNDTPVLIMHGTSDDVVEYDGAGIISYKDEITNSNVEYFVSEGEKQNGHTDLMHTVESTVYLEKVKEEYNQLSEEYNGEIDQKVEAEFYSNIDKHLSSQMNDELMQQIISFYEKHALTE